MQCPYNPAKLNVQDVDTDIQRTMVLLQENIVITAAVLDILHPYVRSLGTADTSRTATNRAVPSREDPITTGATASCPTEADKDTETQVEALLTHATST